MGNINIDKVLENALGNFIGNLPYYVIIGGVSAIGFFKRLQLFRVIKYFLVYLFAKFILPKFYTTIPRLIKIKDCNPIYIVNREGKRKHVPDYETYILLAEVLDFDRHDYMEIPDSIVRRQIKEGKEIPSLIKRDVVFADSLNEADAKILLKQIYYRYLKRGLDSTGEKTYVPILQKGFDGLVEVVNIIKNQKNI